MRSRWRAAVYEVRPRLASKSNGWRVALKQPFFTAFLRSRRIPQVMDVAHGHFNDICRIRWRGRQTSI